MAVQDRTRTEEMDQDERLDWGWDWTAWLAAGETITSLAVTVTGCTLTDSGHDGPLTVAWVTAPESGAVITQRITTTAGRIAEAEIRLIVT